MKLLDENSASFLALMLCCIWQCGAYDHIASSWIALLVDTTMMGSRLPLDGMNRKIEEEKIDYLFYFISADFWVEMGNRGEVSEWWFCSTRVSEVISVCLNWRVLVEKLSGELHAKYNPAVWSGVCYEFSIIAGKYVS